MAHVFRVSPPPFADVPPFEEDDMVYPEPAEPARFVEPVRVSLDAHLTVGNRRLFQTKILALLDKGARNFVCDCSHCDAIDPAGWGVLGRLTRHAADCGGSFVLRGLPPHLARNLAATTAAGFVVLESEARS